MAAQRVESHGNKYPPRFSMAHKFARARWARAFQNPHGLLPVVAFLKSPARATLIALELRYMREGFVSDNQFEIPKAMRDLAEQNMKQAQTAYGQLTNFVT